MTALGIVSTPDLPRLRISLVIHIWTLSRW